jgi:hypothetical protein
LQLRFVLPSPCHEYAISEFDKAMTVAKLRGARERKRREAGKCEGRKSHAERNPELVAQVRQPRIEAANRCTATDAVLCQLEPNIRRSKML